MSESGKVLLIDGMSFLFRAFYGSAWGGAYRQTSTGIYTNAVYGFTKMMLDYAELVRPTHLIVGWDVASRESLVRSQWFDGYKSNRTAPPDELIPQFDLVKELTAAFSVPNIGCPGYEGDDVLGTLSTRLSDEGHEIVIATGDYDSLQLVDEKVSVKILKNGGKHEHYNPASLLALRGISPEQVVDVKALMGDTSDCIPGCPGIGEKTATKLITEHGNLDNLYENLKNCTPKMRSKLEEHRDQVYLSQKLATIIRDVPVEFSMEEAAWTYDSSTVLGKFEELEFGRSLATRVG
ncbi:MULTISPECIES: 5'-3' exonuclease H3TH domain-containing protein [Brevibacillus]|uniref:5'-3' exonuclease n=1 Tax=Brevibacillus parabrevis TaxID=54914 RepID=A0A4Y3PNA7_BREPA|nr:MULTISPECIES: 5'-3' exonuclease H3TH domain-containing protein [Brevibacillus]NRQ55327.1 5'-3' exonuclease [Brevibacillus sp. HD1.4A]MDH6351811.1 5'-3' exonuclease [Brevibacillus sp. 1238]MDR5002099.1 5'-3' exonuclease H3TH domain-containing protein [Brevibacillus parabrevis]MED2253626.1 5'-3' exonuclease H3TH domain-containing protein [Brevibacillus parabrevis]RNB92807.1 5'-3' exonuclease [Brevibacillus parabrevis]